jgi:hypothetical protein
VGGSLPDGHYTLTVRANRIHDRFGQALDGDQNGAAGGNHVDELFRQFGDTDGDGDVDHFDLGVVRGAFGKSADQDGYLWYLDYNANGRIWAEDAIRFWIAFCHHYRKPH